MIKKKIINYRKNYKKKKLLDFNLPHNPIQLFDLWFKEAQKYKKLFEINAMNLATVNKYLIVENRIVLLKEYSTNGFIFFTNYYSRKCKAINFNSNVCLSFYWPFLERQIIIKGIATKINNIKSDNYFKSRPINHQISVLTSKQSKFVKTRSLIDKQFQYYNYFFKNKNIKRPYYWGGIKVKHNNIDFWQGRINRLHDIISYIMINNNWIIKRRYP